MRTTDDTTVGHAHVFAVFGRFEMQKHRQPSSSASGFALAVGVSSLVCLMILSTGVCLPEHDRKLQLASHGRFSSRKNNPQNIKVSQGMNIAVLKFQARCFVSTWKMSLPTPAIFFWGIQTRFSDSFFIGNCLLRLETSPQNLSLLHTWMASTVLLTKSQHDMDSNGEGKYFWCFRLFFSKTGWPFFAHLSSTMQTEVTKRNGHCLFAKKHPRASTGAIKR